MSGPPVEDDCPICLEPLPPFWDEERRIISICCEKRTCKKCYDEQKAYIYNAVANGSYGKAERQLASTCSLCRARKPSDDDAARVMIDRFEKGTLPLSMYSMLGSYYRLGLRGIEENKARGHHIFMLGAEMGDPSCQSLVGSTYHDGEGVPKSSEEAKRWWMAATKQGHAVAEYNLACMYKDEGNDAECLRHLKGSASEGYEQACFYLGMAHCNGNYGLQKSSEEAIHLVTPAAERGHAKSMDLLGFVMCCPEPYLMEPVNPNFTKGMHWLRRAAATGSEDAISHLKEIEDDASSRCFWCNKKAPHEKEHLRCSRCRAAWYCSKDCQRRHWKATEGGHKKCCIKWESR